MRESIVMYYKSCLLDCLQHHELWRPLSHCLIIIAKTRWVQAITFLEDSGTFKVPRLRIWTKFWYLCC